MFRDSEWMISSILISWIIFVGPFGNKNIFLAIEIIAKTKE